MQIRNHHNKEGSLQRGKECWIADNVEIDLTGDVSIGDYTDISEGVIIYSHKHNYRPLGRRREIVTYKIGTTTIGRDVFIGREAMILGPLTIGSGAIIGARAVIRNDVDENEIWSGNPAMKIGERG